MKLIFLFSALFLFQSCTDWKKPKQLDSVEVLNEKLSELEQSYSNYEEYSNILSKVTEVESRLIQNSNGDTLTLDFAKILERYSSISPDIRLIQKQIPYIDSLFEIRNNGIVSLGLDIENGVGNRSKYDQNIKFEETALEELSALVEHCESILQNAILNYKDLNEQVQEYSLELEKKTRNNN